MLTVLRLQHLLSDTIHLFYPHICIGCGSDLIHKNNLLCLTCISELPHTNFAFYTNNPVEKIFAGRLNLRAAHSEFYFSKGQVIQHLIHQLKYKNNKAIGIYLGELMGKTLLKSGKLSGVDYLIPLPLFTEKLQARGYNQAEVICQGIMMTSKIPVLPNNIIRAQGTETQTRKHRAERWDNVANSFIMRDPQALQGKHLLLVDDVLTTGATLEACGQVIMQVPGIALSIATLAHASK